MDETPLAGGNAAGPVSRAGGTVRRRATAATPTIHRLLRHVRAAGLTWVPEPHGVDDAGREVLEFFPGEVPHDFPAWLWSPAVLDQVTRALRQWHDATATFPRSGTDRWWGPEIEPAEVICHGDFAPYNHVFRGPRMVGVIDYDVCRPGPRLWDIAYTGYRYVPLLPHEYDEVPDGDNPDRTAASLDDRLARLDRMIATYAGTDDHLRFARADVLGYAVARLRDLAEWSAAQGRDQLLAHARMYDAHAAWIAGGALGEVTEVHPRR